MRKFMEIFEAMVADEVPVLENAEDDLGKFREDGSVPGIK